MAEPRHRRRSGSRVAAVDRLVGRRVRQRRKALDVRQGDLARALGISPQQLHKYEQGQDRISAGRLFRIAEALGVEVGYFFAPEPATLPPAAAPAHRTPGVRPDPGLAAEFLRQFGNIDDPHVQQAIDALIRALSRTGSIGSLLISMLP